MKRILTEKNCVIVLFVLVLITFALAQEDSKKMEKAISGAVTAVAEFQKTTADQATPGLSPQHAE